MGIYDLNIFKQIKRELPFLQRKPKRAAFLRDLLSRMQTVRDDFFNVYRPDVVERAKYNSQTIVLEYILNKKFDPTLKRIYIVNFLTNLIYVYIHKKSENKPTYIYKKSEAKPLYLLKGSEYAIDFDFIVHCPVTLAGQDKQVRAEIDKYKVAGVNYTVIYDIV